MKVYEIDIMSVSIFVRFLVRFHVCFIGTNEGQNDQCNVSVDAVEAKNYSIFKSYMSALVTLFWMPFQWALCVTMAMCQSL